MNEWSKIALKWMMIMVMTERVDYAKQFVNEQNTVYAVW